MDSENHPVHPLSSRWQFLYLSPQKRNLLPSNPEVGSPSISLLGEVDTVESLSLFVFYIFSILYAFLFNIFSYVFCLRILHKLPKIDCKTERSTLCFFKSHIRPDPEDSANAGGRKLSLQTQYGAIRHHLHTIFTEIVMLLASNSIPSQDNVSGIALNDQNCIEVWIQPSLKNIEPIKTFLSAHLKNVIDELGIKEAPPNIDDKPLKIKKSSKPNQK